MAELIDEQEEEQLKTRMRSRRHIRAVLIVLNLLLIGYLLYFVSDVIIDYVHRNDNDIVNICGLSRNASLKRYDELIQGKTKVIGDYAVYGNYLHLSESSFELNTYTPMSNLWLKRADTGAEIAVGTLGKNMNEGIDFSNLLDGDFLLSQGSGNDKYVLKVVLGKDRWEDTIYSLPNEEGNRKKIDIYAHPDNPAFVIKVETVKKLPKDYYDLLLIGHADARTEAYHWIKETYPNWAVKELNDDVHLSIAYAVKSSYAVVLKPLGGGDPVLTCSSWIASSTFKKDDKIQDSKTILDGYDQNEWIRELGGYAFHSGARVKSSDESLDHSFDVAAVKGMHDAGKMTMLLEASQEQIPSQLNRILDFYMNK